MRANHPAFPAFPEKEPAKVERIVAIHPFRQAPGWLPLSVDENMKNSSRVHAVPAAASVK
jgi:hypothetical protein